jgi:hypothetical protein
MGFVRVELPFSGLKCDDCMYQSDSGYEEKKNYCDLFDQWKHCEERCGACVNNEVRPTGGSVDGTTITYN